MCLQVNVYSIKCIYLKRGSILLFSDGKNNTTKVITYKIPALLVRRAGFLLFCDYREKNVKLGIGHQNTRTSQIFTFL